MSLGSFGSSDSLYGEIILGYGSVVSGDLTVSCSNSFGWQSLVENNDIEVSAVNHFGWVQFTGRNYTFDIIQFFGWTGRQLKNVVNHFAFSPAVNRVYFYDAENFFDWTADSHRLFLASNGFGWSQLLVGIRLFDCFNSLSWETVADPSPTNYGRDKNQGFLRQVVSYTITGNKCLEREYAPLIGSGEDGYDPMPTAPTLGTGTLTLTYPPVGPTHTVSLRNPEFGNAAELSFTKIDRRTRGGERIIFADSKWSHADIHTLQLVQICSAEWAELVDFLNASLGQEINLLDWEGRNWRGVIIAPETEVSFIQGGYTVTLTFQGEVQ